jgi:hypothetical protein
MKTLVLSSLMALSSLFVCNLDAKPYHKHHHHHRSQRTFVNFNVGPNVVAPAVVAAPVMVAPAPVMVAPAPAYVMPAAPVVTYPAPAYYYYPQPVQCVECYAAPAPITWSNLNLGFSFRL